MQLLWRLVQFFPVPLLLTVSSASSSNHAILSLLFVAVDFFKN
jgi:hypothetical protein